VGRKINMAGKKKSKPAERKPSSKKPKSAKPKKASPVGKITTSKETGRGFTLSLHGDRSLQAYKNFVLGILRGIKPDAKDPWTEEEWMEKWKSFWAKGDEAAEKRKMDGTDEASSVPVKEYKTNEERYPGITEQIRQFEEAEVPSCPHCGSGDTASVQVGIIGRTMIIAGSTRKFKLVPNVSDRLGKYFCNECKKYFD
jgi:ribosomal protein L13E